jgi:heat shock protein HtpX
VAIVAAALANWMLLIWAFSLWTEITGAVISDPAQSAALWAFGSMALLSVIALSPAGETLLRVINGCDEPTFEEERKLKPLFAEVCRAASINPDQYKLFVSDGQFPNAFAMGKRTICITSGLLGGFSDEEIKSALAHELGHHAHGDTMRNIVFCMTNLVTFVLILIGYKICDFLDAIPNFAGRIGSRERDFATIFSFFGGLLKILLMLFMAFVWLPIIIGLCAGGRKEEYRADLYAAQIGYGDGLLSLFHRMMKMNAHPEGLMGILHQTHPSTRKRIRRIEQWQQNMSVQPLQPSSSGGPSKISLPWFDIEYSEKIMMCRIVFVMVFCILEYFMGSYMEQHPGDFKVFYDLRIFNSFWYSFFQSKIVYYFISLGQMLLVFMVSNSVGVFNSNTGRLGMTLLMSGYLSNNTGLLARNGVITYITLPSEYGLLTINCADVLIYLGMGLWFYAFCENYIWSDS